MKYYEQLVRLGCFTINDLKQITGSETAAKWICQEYQKKGYIERVKRDLYVTISLETRQPVANRYVIASHLSSDATVSYHSAFEFYGCVNQVFYETYVTSSSRFRDIDYDGVTYRRIAPRITKGITETNGIRVTTPERTVVDSIHLFEKIGGLEKLLRCLALIASLKELKLLEILSEYQNEFLYQKTGYILSAFADSLGLSENFFDICKSHLPNRKSYLSNEHQDYVWNKEWKLFAPEKLLSIIDKGVSNHALKDEFL